MYAALQSNCGQGLFVEDGTGNVVDVVLVVVGGNGGIHAECIMARQDALQKIRNAITAHKFALNCV